MFTWYSHFLMTQYNDLKWIEHFHVNISFFVTPNTKTKACSEREEHNFLIHCPCEYVCSL
jgi:hypothetical protein